MIDHKFKKKYGQNFLVDNNILDKICESIKPKKDDLIIEIGPGSGNLTKRLKEYGSFLLCFEIDNTLSKFLDLLVDDKTKIVYDDFMNINLDDYVDERKYNNIYVIANIPYYITTPIIEKITFSKIKVNSLTLMVQKEVADRLSSNFGNKEYGYITVFLNAFYKINKLFNVNRNSFYPVPNVDSAIIRLESIDNNIDDFNRFNNLIKNAFKFKRKTLKNNLRGYNLEVINNILVKYNYSLNNRAEDIPVNVYIDISNKI